MATNKDLILKVKDLNASQILEMCSDFSERGFMYEALWNIVVKFNCLPNVPISKHIKSNLNKKTKICLTNFSEDFLNKPFRSGNSSGYSDITFKDDKQNLYISTVKFFENDSNKNRDDWDLPKLAALSTIHDNTKNLVFTKDKQQFLKIYNNSNKNDIYLIENVYDLSDLTECLKNVVKILNIYEWNFDKLLEHYFGKQKTTLKLLYHQELCLKKISEMKKSEPVLWGLKCRSGKSYIMAGHIHVNNFTNVLIITPIPNESIKSLVTLFEQYIEFDDYSVVHFQRGTKLPESKKKIIIASKQFLDGKTIPALQDIKFDVVYSDENHWGGTTTNSKKIISTYVKKGTQFVTLTATYSKSQFEWNIVKEQSFFWDLEDETLCKTNNIEELVTKFGENARTVATNHNLQEEYEEMPILTILSVTHDPAFIAKFNQFNTDDSYSFDTTSLLKCNDDGFQSSSCVKDLIDYHFGDGLNNGKNMMDRIKKYNTRTGNSFHTQLWFLPYGAGTNLNQTAVCMKSLIESHKYGKKYAVEILTSENDNSEKGNLYEYIQCLENKAIEESKRGLILLLGFKCSMGISLPLADVVVLLNNGESMDMYMQMMMRSMTESRGTNKKRGFVIDYNQKRVLQTTLNLIRGGETLGIKDTIRRALNVLHIDEDMNVSDKTKIVDKIYDIWKRSKINRIDFIRSRLDQLPSVQFDAGDYKTISNFMKYVSQRKLVPEKVKLELNEENEKLPDGTAEIESGDKESDSEKNDDDEEEEVIIDYGKELLTSIPILAGLLTFREKDVFDILKCLNIIKQDKTLHLIFTNQCDMWWSIKNPEGFVDFLIYLIQKYYLNILPAINAELENMKDSITTLLDNKKELFDTLLAFLTPKLIEKKKYGEVFTPLDLVEKMLDHLSPDVWSNPDLKWFDPTVGVGNFMVCVYYRLLEGLKNVIPDESDRKKHILKNMIYMSELNSKNVFVAKIIFGEDCNINEGDTLLYTPPVKFDIIVGNPPYQEDGATGDNKLYLSFIKYSIDILNEGGKLLFIVPTNVKNYLTCVNKNRDYINELYKLHVLSLNVANNYFNVGSTFAYFLLEKTVVDEYTTRVEYLRNGELEQDTIHIKKGMNVPLCMSNTDIQLINKVSNLITEQYETFPLKKAEYVTKNDKTAQQRIRKQHIDKGIVKRTKTNEFQYKIIDKITKTKPFPGDVYYYDSKMIDFGSPKIVMCTGGYLMPSYDSTGEYNLSDNMIYMMCDSQDEYLGMKFLSESKLVQYLNKVTMTDGLHGRDTVMKSLKKVDLSSIRTDEDVYKAFGVTDNEIKIITSTV
jgi:hypothetical protein